jgi:hypothetical protein
MSRKYRYGWRGNECTKGYIRQVHILHRIRLRGQPSSTTTRDQFVQTAPRIGYQQRLILLDPIERTHDTVDPNVPLLQGLKGILVTNISKRTNSHASSHHLKARGHLTFYAFLSAPQYFECAPLHTTSRNFTTTP